MHIRWFAVAVAMLTGLALPAAAGDCSPLKLVTSVVLQFPPSHRIHYVPITLNDRPGRLILDTGAANTIIWPKAAAALGLKSYATDRTVFDVTGHGSSAETITSLTIGRMRGDAIHIGIAPSDMSDLDDDVFGLLGADILSNYDLSIDFGSGRLDLLSPDHCQGKFVYWPERPISIIPFTFSDSFHIVFPVTLDGKELTATLDTGAWNSTLLDTTARKEFDIVSGDAATPSAGYLNGDIASPTYSHRFASLSLAGLEVKNPKLMIIPDRMSKHFDTGPQIGSHLQSRNRIEDQQILLGMDVLKHLHIYIAYKEKTLVITPDGPASAAQ